MKRREVITLLGGAAAWPLAVRAQGRMALVGFLGPNSAGTTPNVAALLDGLKQAGYIEGQNLAMEYRFADDFGRLSAESNSGIPDLIAKIKSSIPSHQRLAWETRAET